MHSNKSYLFLFLLFVGSPLSAQQTVGLFINTPEAFPGYTLFAPMGNTTTYLINNCGQKVHSWPSAHQPAMTAYLMEDGSLIRTINTNNTNFPAGGSGGGIERIDWEGNVIWEYRISDSTECQHHDIEILPNGNILAIVWEYRSVAEAINAGKTNANAAIWSEKIVEIKPDLVNGGGTIVWEWNAWDHLIQDVDTTRSNHGSIAASPGLININHTPGLSSAANWLHINSVDYHAGLDQILLSVYRTNEIWIIDHSTSTLEAAGHTGGKSGKGGDLLYRWGNPLAYKRGVVVDQKLFRQHDANWIGDGLPGGGKIMVFNNQAGGQIQYSTVNIIDPPVDGNGNYTFSGIRYGPVNFDWTYKAPVPTDFYSVNISGAQRLPNGNTLICEGTSGRFFEVNDSGQRVWEYVNPVSPTGVTEQGTAPQSNFVFRCTRYAKDYAAFSGREIATQGFIETGSTFSCISLQTEEVLNEAEIVVYPNPAKTSITIRTESGLKKILLYNTLGVLVYASEIMKDTTSIPTHSFAEGLYLLYMELPDGSVKKQYLSICP